MAILVKLLFYLVRLIPVRLAGAIGAGLGRLAFYLDARHRAIAMRNLNRVYPDKPEAWKRRISRESFAELGRTSFELPHVFLRSKSFLLSRMDIKNSNALDQAKAQNKGVVLVACHHSNWELGALAISMLSHSTNIIYRTVRQPALDEFVLRARKRFGATMHPRDTGLRWIPRALKSHHCIAVMVDQHLSSGTPVPFLGHEARTTTMPAILNHKYNTPVVGVSLRRIGKGFNFVLEFRQIPIDENISDEVTAMQIICANFAPMIHERPELWLWIHRRWLYLDEKEQAEQDIQDSGEHGQARA